MELVNIFLETDSGRLKLCCDKRDKTASDAVKNFIDVLSEYIDIEQSDFYLVVKDKDIFYFKCDRGSVSIVNNEFYVFDETLLFTSEYDKVTGVEFVITESMPTRLIPRRGYAVTFVVSTHRFYDGSITL
ncbi:virion core protein [NY_014 poxvirus]|uniref:virion core protein n=1 Tax=NY_014 poxvirus TaxID=2025360 RepID=UPI000B99F9E3|nr:virion core protein [NY_014 poxvirus]AST09459.1 virion core protein [NY_014 poxvirus]